MKIFQKIWKARNPWPTAIIGYFILFISFLIGFVAFASRQKVELVAKDYYANEILYQQQIERNKRTQPFHGRVFIKYYPESRTAVAGLPAEHLSGSLVGKVRFYRPSNAQLDREFVLSPDAAGRQTFDVTRLESGLWRVKIDWKANGLEYSYETSIVLGL
jgi:hypothetical protein